MKYFYEEYFYPLTWYDNDKPISTYQSGIEFWPINSLYNTPEQESLDANLRKLFNITHSVTYLEKNDNFLEIFRFFSDNNQIYLLDLKILWHFIFYFKEHRFIKSIPVKRYYLKGKLNNVYLTHHEREYLHWYIQGKTCEEIAIIFGVSKKTIENTIYKIKQKLRCYKQLLLSSRQFS
ncbi:MAG: hypothetical protein JSR33_01625 [Proteobacteria bacterium]|nr:hypothetical protein [Pseudomonadota bacterium]